MQEQWASIWNSASDKTVKIDVNHFKYTKMVSCERGIYETIFRYNSSINKIAETAIYKR